MHHRDALAAPHGLSRRRPSALRTPRHPSREHAEITHVQRYAAFFRDPGGFIEAARDARASVHGIEGGNSAGRRRLQLDRVAVRIFYIEGAAGPGGAIALPGLADRDAMGFEMRAQGRLVEAFEAQAEMVHVAARRARPGPALPAELAVEGHEVDEGAAGAKLEKPELRLPFLDRAEQDVAVEGGHAFEIGDAQHDMVERGNSDRRRRMHLHVTPPAGAAPRISVPAPSVKSSSRIACSMRPSRMTAASTPPSTASRQVSTLGIMPPLIVPSAIMARASAAESSGRSRFSRSSTPATSVRSRKRVARTAAATAPATVSALMLKVSPAAPTPIGEMTGMMSERAKPSSMAALTRSTSPTKPRSSSLSMLLSGSRRRRSSLRARMRAPSLPESPMAVPPARLMAAASCLLIEPESTISTISTVAWSVTRSPSTKADLILSRSSICPICGPPPWTTMGLMPTCFSSTTSRAKLSPRTASPIAWPPYLTRIVLPA